MPNSTNKKLIRQLLICAIFVISIAIGSDVISIKPDGKIKNSSEIW